MTIKRNDLLLFGSILLLAVLCFALYRFAPKEGGTAVQITIDGTPLKTLPLDQDITYPIRTGNHTNLLQIKDGSASIIEADCPDKLCVHQHSISKAGETLVCLPHKVVISVQSSGEDSSGQALDGIAK